MKNEETSIQINESTFLYDSYNIYQTDFLQDNRPALLPPRAGRLVWMALRVCRMWWSGSDPVCKKNSSAASCFLHLRQQKWDLRILSPFQVVLGIIVNSAVHVLMYTYYFLAACGPSVRPYLWWKRYITRIQIGQFVGLLFHILIPMFYDCGYPRGRCDLYTKKSDRVFSFEIDFLRRLIPDNIRLLTVGLLLWAFAQGTLGLVLFINFYMQSYIVKHVSFFSLLIFGLWFCARDRRTNPNSPPGWASEYADDDLLAWKKTTLGALQ